MFDTILKLFYVPTLFNPNPLAPPIPTFKIDRLIDSHVQLYVGVTSSGKQAVRIGKVGDPIYELKEFKNTETELEYQFDNNITLNFNKPLRKYTLTTPSITRTNDMKLCYKVILLDSKELDEIEKIYE
jgi:hypothetical protein